MRDASQLAQDKRAVLARHLRGDHLTSLAQALRRHDLESPRARSPLVAVHPDGTNRPFFFLHGDYRDHPLWCMNLAHDLGSDQPFYALQPEKLDSRIAPTLEEHAAAHLRLVRDVQPTGPYMLGGWCGGALLAFEMAQQLYTAGEKVDLLVLMEPPAIPVEVKMVRHVLTHLGSLRRLGSDAQLDQFLRVLPALTYWDHLLRRTRKFLRRVHRRQVHHTRFPHRAGAEVIRRLKGITSFKIPARTYQSNREREEANEARPRHAYLDIFTWMAAAYAIRPCSSRVALFWSSEEFLDTPRAAMAWCRTAESAEVHVISGTLTTTRTEHVHDLSAHLSACLHLTRTAAAP